MCTARYSLRGLSNLVKLDLSYNLLGWIPSTSFVYTHQLRYSISLYLYPAHTNTHTHQIRYTLLLVC